MEDLFTGIFHFTLHRCDIVKTMHLSSEQRPDDVIETHPPLFLIATSKKPL
jgi:hypothetical protein